MLRNKKGQSTLEYVILVTAVVVVLILFLGSEGTFRSVLGNTYKSMADGMSNVANRLTNSWIPGNASK